MTDDELFLLLLRVVKHHLEHKTVDLRLRKRVSPLLFYRVLGRENEEGCGQLVGIVPDGDLSLLHRLQKSTLHLCGRAVNLIRKDKVCKDGSLLHLKLFALLTVNERTDEVGWQKIGRKLYAGKVPIDTLREGTDG